MLQTLSAQHDVRYELRDKAAGYLLKRVPTPCALGQLAASLATRLEAAEKCQVRAT